MPGSINVAEKNGADANKDSLAKDLTMGNLLGGKLTNIALPKPEGELKLFFDTNAMADLWIAIAWKE